jgi:hypothetical protein
VSGRSDRRSAHLPNFAADGGEAISHGQIVEQSSWDKSLYKLRYVGNPTYLQMLVSFIFAGPCGDLVYFNPTSSGAYVG